MRDRFVIVIYSGRLRDLPEALQLPDSLSTKTWTALVYSRCGTPVGQIIIFGKDPLRGISIA